MHDNAMDKKVRRNSNPLDECTQFLTRHRRTVRSPKKLQVA